jgi:hypothetical protein
MGDSASDRMDLDNLTAVPDVAVPSKVAHWSLPKPKIYPKSHEPAVIGTGYSLYVVEWPKSPTFGVPDDLRLSLDPRYKLRM